MVETAYGKGFQAYEKFFNFCRLHLQRRVRHFFEP